MAQTEKLTHKDVKEMVKHDAFREKTLEIVGSVTDHKSEVVKWGGLGLGILLLAGGVWFYRDHQHTVRQNAFNHVMKVKDSTVVESGNPPQFVDVWFKSKDEQKKAQLKAYNDLIANYPNSDEATIARYYLGVTANDDGNTAEAEKQLKIVSDQGSADYSSLAKLALAQIYKGQGKLDDASKLVRDLVDHPSAFVTKEHATIELARLIGSTKPDEARKLLEPLRTGRSAISQIALTALSELPPAATVAK